MRNIRRLCATAVILVMICGLLRADIIRFKDGTELHGQIIAKTDDFFLIKLEDGIKKISMATVQEIIKIAGQTLGTLEMEKPRSRISDMKKLSLEQIEVDLNTWLKISKPFHHRQTRKLAEAQIAVRLKQGDAMYVWISKWIKNTFSSVGLNDTGNTLNVLKGCKAKIGEDIHTLDRRSECRDCHGKGLKHCRICDGSGMVRDDIKRKKPKYTGFKKSTILRKVIKRCLSCKGKGILKCDGWTHEPEKRMKKIGGLNKMVEIEIAIKKHCSILNTIKNEIRQNDTKRLRKLAERCRQERYYYLTLQILQRLNEKGAQ